MSDETAHEEVVTSLLDLQALLRGDGAEEVATQTAVQDEAPQDLIRVPEAAPVFVNSPEAIVQMFVTSAAAEDATETEADTEGETVSVVENDLSVGVESDEDRPFEALPDDREGYFAPVTALHPASSNGAEARLAALSERLTALESELDGVLDRMGQFDPARLVRLEAIHEELESQQENLKAAIDSHFTELQQAIAERLQRPEA
ncbi:MAG: hypothetical protein ABI828_04345 [Actinomycetota bacterium]